MTKKIQLTQEQANKVELAKELKDRRVPLLEYVAKNQEIPNASYRCLKGISLDDLARVLYEPNSYEVIPAIKVGDWVVKADGEKFLNGATAVKIEDVKEPYAYWGGAERKNLRIVNFRPATPEEIKSEKERQLWAKLGREVGEFRVGDVRVDEDGYTFSVSSESEVVRINGRYNKGLVRGFYPVEGFISFEEDASDDEGR